MIKGMDPNQILIAVLAIGILILSGYVVYSTRAPTTESTMDVSGTAQMNVDPDKVEVYMTVETLDESANIAQKKNADIMQEVRSVLSDLGFRASDIETTAYYLYEDKEYDKDGDVIFRGYKTIHSIKITSMDLNKAGAIVDASVSAGVNRIDSIVFGLTDAKRDQIKAQVVNSSIDNAKQKAEVQAARIGVKVIKVKYFSESSSISPYLRYEGIAAMPSQASTEITPGQIEISASVSVTYLIE